MSAILIDASGYIHRSYHAHPPVVRSDGTPIGCVYGFCNMLWSMLKKHHSASHVGVIFDSGRSAHRLALYPAYKAQRSPMPDDLRQQLPLVREAVQAFGYHVIDRTGVEADDLIASYAKAFRALSHDVVIVSVDKDLAQIVGPGVSIFDPVKRRDIGVLEVIERFGVRPEQVVEVQALIGDTADNIPGAPGIGPKKAAALFAQFGSLDEILRRAGEVAQRATRETLLLSRDQILLSKALATLLCDVPLPVPLAALENRQVAGQGAVDFARRMEMTSLAGDLAAFYRIGEAV